MEKYTLIKGQYNLFLDDDRTIPTHMDYLLGIGKRGFHTDYFYLDWEVAKNYNDFCEIITRKGLPERISFDHDLGIEPQTGYDCIKWLVALCMEHEMPLTTECKFHTANPVGEVNMRGYYENFLKFQADNLDKSE